MFEKIVAILAFAIIAIGGDARAAITDTRRSAIAEIAHAGAKAVGPVTRGAARGDGYPGWVL